MAIFQKSVIKKNLKNLDAEELNLAYKRFREIYSTAKIAKIRTLKEEEYQDGFLRDIFVKVLGYNLKPDANFDLVREYKNQTDSKKVDGAILYHGQIHAVIELKSTSTKDLTKVTQQAFNYKNNQAGCRYVITSNFQKLRFYIDYANEFEEFDLFNLQKSDFDLLYLILHRDRLIADFPQQLKVETQFHEENISKELYKDYSKFKNDIFENLVKNNFENSKFPIDKLTLFKKSQKLLDRFLFLFFAEDCGLVQANLIARIIKRYQLLKEEDAYKPLYQIYKQYFDYLNKGRNTSNPLNNIPAYNGGLFAPDPILDKVKIDDEVLNANALKISAYDFNTEVDVNILGHIFEHSLNEMEEMEALLNPSISENTETKKTSKRKKDGVFYTPKYITQYIVENTIGTLCTEKRKEMDIYEIVFDKTHKTKKGLSQKGKKLLQTLNDYKKWLDELKIIDPACGSGAFLNQALNFLIAEHKLIADFVAELKGEEAMLFGADKAILENNLFGVDINEESVEIAKLSLWLRTARRGRKLSKLNNNIKCGNSLIDDPKVAVEKAFDWNLEFKEIMDKGGFDVVIGNPPYVDIKNLEPNLVRALFDKYKTAENRINLYSIFIERAYFLVKDKGFVSFINPNSILVNSSYTKIRKFLIDDITKIVKLPDNIFSDAKVETIIFEFRKNSSCKSVDIITYPRKKVIEFVDNALIKLIDKNTWNNTKNYNYNIYVSNLDIKLLQKIELDSLKLGNLADFSLGITPYDKYKGHSKELIQNRGHHAKIKINDNYKPLISGGDILRYSVVSDKIKEYINYGEGLGAMREERFFTEPRVIVRQIISGKPPRIYAGYTKKHLYFTQIGFSIIPKSAYTIDLKYLAVLLNSQLINYYHKYKFLDLEKDLFQKILIANCREIPIKEIPIKAQKPFIVKADKMLSLNKALQKEKSNFLATLEEEKHIGKLSKKLQNFETLSYDDFKKELAKKKIKFNLGAENNEWRDYFTQNSQKVQEIQAQITQCDKEIDAMVYKLYELSDAEIGIVEGSLE